MALTDTFVKNVKHAGSVAGDKHTDGAAIELVGVHRVQPAWQFLWPPQIALRKRVFC